MWNLLPGELWEIFAAHSLGWWQTFLCRPGAGHYGVAQLWPCWLVFGSRSVTGYLPENESERPRGRICVWRAEENVHSYFRAGAVYLVHGLPLTKTNRAHLRRGQFPNKPRYTSRVAFRLKRKRNKSVLHVPAIRRACSYWAESGASRERAWEGNTVHMHTHRHTLTHNHAHTLTFTHIHTHVHTQT